MTCKDKEPLGACLMEFLELIHDMEREPRRDGENTSWVTTRVHWVVMKCEFCSATEQLETTKCDCSPDDDQRYNRSGHFYYKNKEGR